MNKRENNRIETDKDIQQQRMLKKSGLQAMCYPKERMQEKQKRNEERERNYRRFQREWIRIEIRQYARKNMTSFHFLQCSEGHGSKDCCV